MGESSPSWDALYEIALSQLGYFTTRQAASVGYSPQLLYKYLHNGTVTRVLRGVYRLVHFPAGQEEDLVPLWLWSDQAGTFSHETALALYDLSDALPSRVHMTLPASWCRRRLRVPTGLVLHHADLGNSELSDFAVVPTTTPGRTLRDCIDADVAPDLVNDALRQARQRGMISRDEDTELAAAIAARTEEP